MNPLFQIVWAIFAPILSILALHLLITKVFKLPSPFDPRTSLTMGKAAMTGSLMPSAPSMMSNPAGSSRASSAASADGAVTDSPVRPSEDNASEQRIEPDGSAGDGPRVHTQPDPDELDGPDVGGGSLRKGAMIAGAAGVGLLAGGLPVAAGVAAAWAGSHYLQGLGANTVGAGTEQNAVNQAALEQYAEYSHTARQHENQPDVGQPDPEHVMSPEIQREPGTVDRAGFDESYGDRDEHGWYADEDGTKFQIGEQGNKITKPSNYHRQLVTPDGASYDYQAETQPDIGEQTIEGPSR